jgi:hypothetical protein
MPTLPPVVRQVASGAALMLPGILSILVVAMLVLLASVLLAKVKRGAKKKAAALPVTEPKKEGGRNTTFKTPQNVASSTRAGSAVFADRQAAGAARTAIENLKSAVEAWHGGGSTGKSIREAAGDFVDRKTLSDSLKRTRDEYNREEETKKNHELLRSDDFIELRSVPISRVLRLTSLPKMGRGDGLTEVEIGLIKERYHQKCRNFKNAPHSTGSNDPNIDDFAATVNEVFAETRPTYGKKSMSTQFTSPTMLRWAKLCDISFAGLVSAGDYRSAALSNWRNMISNIAGWLGLIHASERKIRSALMFNCDDTTLFLDQKKQAGRTLVSNDAKKKGRAMHLSFSLSINRKNHATQRSSKHYAHRQRTVKLNCVTSATGKLVCTVIQISDYAITRVQLTELTPGIFLVLQPGKAKGLAAKAADQESESKARVKLATRILRDCTLKSIVAEKNALIAQSKHALEIDSQGSGKFTNSPLKDDEICLEGDRAVLCFDGDYPYIEAILSDANKTSDGLTLRECFALHNIELVKFSGGCSMAQQPNDRSRCFYCLKQSIKKFVYKGLRFPLNHAWRVQLLTLLCRSRYCSQYSC